MHDWTVTLEATFAGELTFTVTGHPARSLLDDPRPETAREIVVFDPRGYIIAAFDLRDEPEEDDDAFVIRIGGNGCSPRRALRVASGRIAGSLVGYLPLPGESARVESGPLPHRFADLQRRLLRSARSVHLSLSPSTVLALPRVRAVAVDGIPIMEALPMHAHPAVLSLETCVALDLELFLPRALDEFSRRQQAIASSAPRTASKRLLATLARLQRTSPDIALTADVLWLPFRLFPAPLTLGRDGIATVLGGVRVRTAHEAWQALCHPGRLAHLLGVRPDRIPSLLADPDLLDDR
ncbi:hypothetical protein OO015_13580 [Thermomicrobium sp. 4228-Ro]|uniref:hypothetical protein n=1 Tax=Thermomicrobium sp. 4228-Ro TaxID=2993937 RepID=UPI002248DE04|nr:hypothetical protein [Thermomicrobium sp. 4228-Ro]MCX2728516.1 hypothetical protein [Thermomicrobium sp. 4228-Ro]